MADITFDDLLTDNGPVAIIIKQPLAPVDEDERVIFPPTYPVAKWSGRVHTIRDGDYCVTVELPSASRTDKTEKREDQRPGYQIDHFPDGTNVCEIDSPQSQSNRIEPRFKTIDGGKLVPQVEIRVGKEKVNLLDVGHRAGDAIVRMSSLAAEIHEAFLAAKSGDCFLLAMLAPTSLVFGVWDSRSTQFKLQRVLKAHIRATNVRELSRSAQYTPAIAYVDAGAISQDVESRTGDESNLSQEGMLHALSTQTIGGVMLTSSSRLVRTVTVNLEAIRALQGKAPRTPSQVSEPAPPTELRAGAERESGDLSDGTVALQRYILGLALVAALDEPALNLREGCHLKCAGEGSVTLVHRSKPAEPHVFNDNEVLAFAKEAKTAFFGLAGRVGSEIDRGNVVFETGVAESFLARPQKDRDAIRKLGPIVQRTLDAYDASKRAREQAGDPRERLRRLVEGLKTNKAGTKLNAGPLRKLTDHLNGIAEDDELRPLANRALKVLDGSDDPQIKIQQLNALIDSVASPLNGDQEDSDAAQTEAAPK